jgi:tRNA uridine 5-carbamoylmethylation protein Kti12
MPESPEQNTTVENRSGHLEIIGETAAKLLLFQQGWNPYSRFLDVDKVDLILRRNRQNAPEYREIQVKYRRLYEPDKPSRWDAKLFSVTAWYTANIDEFASHRPGFFVMFVFGYPNRRIEPDVLIFPSRVLHEIIQLSASHKKDGDTKSLFISKSLADSRWYVRLTRRKIAQIDTTNCEDVTKYRNNFAILD